MRITEAPIVRELTTLRLGGKAVALVEVDDERDFETLPGVLKRLGGRLVSFGRGSNILAGDGDLDRVLVRPALAREPQVITRDAEETVIRADAGLPLPRLLAWAAKRGLSGLEGLSGIPGHVGGSAAMNAGSYGVELGDLLRGMRVFTLEKGLRTLTPGGFVPEYRETVMPGLEKACWHMIWDVDLALRTAEPAAIEAYMAENLQKKKAGQPVTAHSAGCVFRNPEGASAGKMMDEAGLRGKRLGGMAFSSMHANFLVNEGNGTSAEAMELIALAEHLVGERFGVQLRREVIVWLSC